MFSSGHGQWLTRKASADEMCVCFTPKALVLMEILFTSRLCDLPCGAQAQHGQISWQTGGCTAM